MELMMILSAQFYAVADSNGPISIRINAVTARDARNWFLEQDGNFVDDGRTDAEDDLGFCGEGMDHGDFAVEMEKRGYDIADCDLVGDHNWMLFKRVVREN
jgi:hypothetical protein